MFIVFRNWNIAIKLSAQCNFVLEEQRNILQAEMKTSTKNVRLFIRLQKEKKEAWKKLCDTRKISLTNFIIDSVEQKMQSDERRKVLAFIEKQDNLFAKIENNINQVAIHANTYGVYPDEIAGLQKDYTELWGRMNDILKQLSAIVEL